MAVVRHKAAIHSGHFMVSDFEPDEQDEDEVAIPPTEEGSVTLSHLIAEQEAQEEVTAAIITPSEEVQNEAKRNKHTSGNKIRFSLPDTKDKDISLSTLFKSMTVAYRHRLTSPRWNRFRGLKLRWKDKIRMNNVIWRCWHMQFMKNDPRSLCAFANPMEIDNHNKMEGTTLLEGKYWKRKLETIQTEYSKWRIFYHQQNHGGPCADHPMGHGSGSCVNYSCGSTMNHDAQNDTLWENFMKSPSYPLMEGTRDDVDLQSMLNDEGMIVDLLLNTLQESSMSNTELNNFFSSNSSSSYNSNTHMSVAVPFPNPKDYYKTTTNADLLQPGLGPLQPNLDDMDLDLDWLNVTPPVMTNQHPLSNGKLIKNAVVDANMQQQTTHLTQPPAQQPQKLANSVLPVTANGRQDNLELANRQPGPILTNNQQPINMISTNQMQQPNHMHPAAANQRSGGGKHRSILAHHQQQQLVPYPAKIRSPVKERLLTHQHQRYQSYDLPPPQPVALATAVPPQQNAVLPDNSYKSELVQLLKSENKPQLIVKEHHGPAAHHVLPHNPNGQPQLHHQPVHHVQPHPLQNGYHQQPHIYMTIPPPLTTDYQQDDKSVSRAGSSNSFRGFTNTPQYAEHRRSVHINSEQNRRTSIKHGFDDLRSLIPSLKDVPVSSHKISKAALLHKGGDYIRQMKSECLNMDRESEHLRAAIEALELDVSTLQGNLPAHKLGQDGSSSNICGLLRQKKAQEDNDKINSAFANHVETGTSINWKYWAFSRLMRPHLDSYVESVSGNASMNEMDRTVKRWLEDKCSVIQIRQSVVTSLKNISTHTNILRDPRGMPQEALELARRENKH